MIILKEKTTKLNEGKNMSQYAVAKAFENVMISHVNHDGDIKITDKHVDIGKNYDIPRTNSFPVQRTIISLLMPCERFVKELRIALQKIFQTIRRLRNSLKKCIPAFMALGQYDRVTRMNATAWMTVIPYSGTTK
ncbi:hypothetical protein DW842_11730 [Ruminococcus sp. AM36-17]|nr:hypothetical protein DW842_11730 [Ruminococcus sp. AM36-17]